MRWAVEIALACLFVSSVASAQACHEGTIEGDRIVWRSTIDGRRVVARQPIGDALTPPPARGPQRITLAGARRERVSFVPDDTLERHVGYHATLGMTHRTMRALDHACGRAPAQSVRIYVDATNARLGGQIVRGDDRRRPFLIVGGLLLFALIVIGALAYRCLARRAEIEDAEAAIEERFRALGDP